MDTKLEVAEFPTVFKELPYAAVLTEELSNVLCYFCFNGSSNMIRCAHCMKTCYCSQLCQLKDYDIHKHECEVFCYWSQTRLGFEFQNCFAQSFIFDRKTRMLARIIIRNRLTNGIFPANNLLIGPVANNQFTIRNFEEAVNSITAPFDNVGFVMLKETKIAVEKYLKLFDKYFSVVDIFKDIFEKEFQKVLALSMNIRVIIPLKLEEKHRKIIGCAVYLQYFNRFKHSCDPDLILADDENCLVAKLKLVKHKDQGESVLNELTMDEYGPRLRRTTLGLYGPVVATYQRQMFIAGYNCLIGNPNISPCSCNLCLDVQENKLRCFSIEEDCPLCNQPLILNESVGTKECVKCGQTEDIMLDSGLGSLCVLYKLRKELQRLELENYDLFHPVRNIQRLHFREKQIHQFKIDIQRGKRKNQQSIREVIKMGEAMLKSYDFFNDVSPASPDLCVFLAKQYAKVGELDKSLEMLEKVKEHWGRTVGFAHPIMKEIGDMAENLEATSARSVQCCFC